jgi:hypothetical protein
MKRLVHAALAFALATIAFAADHPDFTGNWKIDPSKMDSSKGAPPRMIRKVEKEGNIIIVTEVQVRDGRETAILRKFSTDGTLVTSMLNGQRVKCHGMWDGNTLVSDTTIGEGVTVHEVWALSDDGQTWTNDVVFNGRPSKFVFTRQYLP